ncbi:hypothetical protein [Saccharothrix deserti]|uniref:hypothetical protein n=1 Tax=Saccharothrix deserti TaxID=2593674 RepID=UPI003083FD0F
MRKEGTSRLPSSGSPTQTKPTVAPASVTDAMKVAWRGAPALRSRQPRSAVTASSKRKSAIRARLPTGCNRNSNPVTIPKFPPPPRRPQNSSGFSVAVARTSSPSAVTIS